MKYIACGILSISVFLLVGCSLFTNPNEQPVIEEKLNRSLFSKAEVGTLSLTPERRVLVNFGNGRFCAEAPTEVGLDISRLFKLAAKANTGDELKAGFEAISAANSSNAVLNRRTQGMQLFLASAYFSCQMYMNDAITRKELIDIQMRALEAAGPLIKLEIELMPELAIAQQKKEQQGSDPGAEFLDNNSSLDTIAGGEGSVEDEESEDQ